jgi:hypothetical protein
MSGIPGFNMADVPDSFQAFIKIETGQPDFVGMTVCGAGGAPIYSYIQMREEGMRIISDQILTWLAECDRARELAAATNVIEV